jgi:hypothetical protein
MLRRPGALLAALPLAAGLPQPALAQPAPAAAEAPQFLETPPGRKPRVVITADPELDDNNSLIRYLLYSADFDTVGLIYANSQFHWKGDGQGTEWYVPGREYRRFGLTLCPCTSWRWSPDERFIDDAVDAYAAAYPNLRVHDPDYPSPDALRAVIRWGNVEFDGEMAKDTPGSDLIRSLLLDDDPSPVYLHAWGGQSTIARALKAIEEQYEGTLQWPAIRAKVSAKAVIHASGDQDDTYARYIEPFWPEIRYRHQTGGVGLSYGAQGAVSNEDAAYFTPEWTAANVSTRGSLGALYRVWGDGKQMVHGDKFDYFGVAGKTAQQLRDEGYVVWSPLQPHGAFLGEGDTPTFLNLIDNGLAGYREDSFGGWGGTAAPEPQPSFAAGFAALEATAAGQAPQRPRPATHPFLAAAQNDFAARMAWAVTPRHADANHPPAVALAGEATLAAHPGDTLHLKVKVSDPDRDAVSVHWRHWDEADSYPRPIALASPAGLAAVLQVPADARPGDTIHLLAEATDDGTPALTRYARVIVRVAVN